MAKRHARVKLSRAQKLENERNRWLAKKDAAIAMLVKSMERLKSLNRSVARMERTAQLPVKAKVANMTLAEIKAEPVEQKVGWVFPEAKPVDDGLDIPKDLDRRLNGLSDPRTKEKKAERRAVEKEVRDAELTGQRRRRCRQQSGNDPQCAIQAVLLAVTPFGPPSLREDTDQPTYSALSEALTSCAFGSPGNLPAATSPIAHAAGAEVMASDQGVRGGIGARVLGPGC